MASIGPICIRGLQDLAATLTGSQAPPQRHVRSEARAARPYQPVRQSERRSERSFVPLATKRTPPVEVKPPRASLNWVIRFGVRTGERRLSRWISRSSPDCCYATPQREESPEAFETIGSASSFLRLSFKRLKAKLSEREEKGVEHHFFS